MRTSAAILVGSLCSIVTASPLNSFPPTRVPIDNRSLAEIYTAAQKEHGTLQVAWGGDEVSQGIPTSQAFSQAFPNIKLNLTVDLSKYHVSRINRAEQEGTSYVDVAVLQTLGDFELWKESGHLLPYKPPTFSEIYAELRDADGAWLPYVLRSFGGFVYNANKTGNAQIPVSYADVLRPEWKSKLVLTYPNDDDAIAFVFYQIIRAYGFEWLDNLVKQDVQWVRGTQTPATIVNGNSSRSLSFTTFPIASLNQSFPTTDQYLTWPQRSAILSSTEMPETAKLFTAFIQSTPIQTTVSEQNGASIRKDIGTPIWNFTNTEAAAFNRFLLQRNVIEAWRFQYETVLGPAVGLNPVHDDI